MADFDILIVGGGMVGMALAAALGQTPLRVGLVEVKVPHLQRGQVDPRASAIALGSAQILEQIGAWKTMQSLGVSPIHQVVVSDAGFPLTATLHREDLGVSALGYVVENWVTETALAQVIAAADRVQWIRPARVGEIATQPNHLQVTLRHPDDIQQVSAHLVVGADGRQSSVRQGAHIPLLGWDYPQALIVCTITTEYPHHQTGYERFHASGPFAILPMVAPADQADTHRSCVVWTAPLQERDSLMALADTAFIQAMTPRLSPDLGRVLSVSRRTCYAPRCQHSKAYQAHRRVLVGDAAHATHPVGGQGLNMGLRDVAVLATLLRQAQTLDQDPGQADLLRQYQQQRQTDNAMVLLGTDWANRLFSNSWLPLQWIRRLGLVGLEYSLPLKRELSRYAMGLATHHPAAYP